MSKLKLFGVVLPAALLATAPLRRTRPSPSSRKNQTNPYFQTVRGGAESRRQGDGANVVHYIPTKPDSIPSSSARSRM